MTEDGRGVDTLHHPSAAEYDWVDVNSVDRVWAQMVRNGRLTDSLPSHSFDHLFLSARGRAALEGLRWERYVRVLPATILDRQGKKVADYHFFHPTQEFDAVDYDRSEFEYFSAEWPGIPHKDGRPIRSVTKYVLRPDRVPEADLFMESYRRWIVTQAVVDRFQHDGITGCEFTRARWSDEVRAHTAR
jgi:hypothetical protein